MCLLVFIAILLCLPGCQLARDAWYKGGRDDISCDLGWTPGAIGTQAVQGRDGSVAFLVRLCWNPALAPSREFRRYYIFTPDDLVKASRDPEWVTGQGEGVPRLGLRLSIAKFRAPTAAGLGHFVPSGSDVPGCSEEDLPEALRHGVELVVNPPRLTNTSAVYFIRRSDGQLAVVEIDKKSFRLDWGGEWVYRFQTPVGQLWQVVLVPVAALADVVWVPIYTVLSHSLTK